MAEDSCGLFMVFELLMKQENAVNGPRKDDASTRNAWREGAFSDPSHALQVYPSRPSWRFTEPLWSICCPPSWEARRCEQPLVSHFKSHILSLRTQRFRPYLQWNFICKNRPDSLGCLNMHLSSFSVHHPRILRIWYSSSRCNGEVYVNFGWSSDSQTFPDPWSSSVLLIFYWHWLCISKGSVLLY